LVRHARNLPAAPIVRKKAGTGQRALSFQITEENDKLTVPSPPLERLHEMDSDEEQVEGNNDTINSLPFPPTVRRYSTKSISTMSPTKSSMFQTPAAIRSTMNRLPTETAMSQRIRDVEVPPSVMKELESDKRLLGLNERHDKSGVLTLREQGAVIDKLRKENFGLKIKVFYLEGKINQQYDEAARDVMKEVFISSICLT
jgi:Centrosomin N-terminal motif 1